MKALYAPWITNQLSSLAKAVCEIIWIKPILQITQDLEITMIFWKASLAIAITFSSFSAVYAAESQSVAMDFDQCLQIIRGTSTDLGVAPINIAETDILRIVRYVTEDGSVLITCSKPDRKIVITKSN